MFVAKQFTIRSLMLVLLYAAVMAAFMGGDYPGYRCATVVVWLVPVALAMVIHRRLLLAMTCAAFNLSVFAVGRTVCFATWKLPGYETVSDVAGDFFMGAFAPAMIFGNGGVPEEVQDIIYIVAWGALMYALVGLGFSYCFSPRGPSSSADSIA